MCVCHINGQNSVTKMAKDMTKKNIIALRKQLTGSNVIFFHLFQQILPLKTDAVIEVAVTFL